ncbi:thiamine phosphate synthase [Halorientalis regularis]|jgi:thiamine-phosphate pyrophosphorylase|uniref:Thiamine-phosphate synthase n=1 Tax=Halorientalis regularis TaxID=660518 RepID=A0A1G7JV26_9EURY|nr:thiamine phosphate synthase [Halorientalis regularis]SDF28793.1 thiamine-phosphate diphosphorylase [Halorientalis regularis]
MNLDTYLVTAEAISAGRSTVEIVEAAIDGGIDVVQLREKEMSARKRYDLGLELRDLTREADVPLLVNDRIDLAAAIDADGVHLGDADLPISVARDQLGEDAIVGRSVSTPEAAREAERRGADYLGVGAVYPTDSKDTDPEGTEIGLDRIRAVAEAVEIPSVGIGGVKPDNAAAVIETGADGVAVISAITAADDPAAATRALGAAVERGRE